MNGTVQKQKWIDLAITSAITFVCAINFAQPAKAAPVATTPQATTPQATTKSTWIKINSSSAIISEPNLDENDKNSCLMVGSFDVINKQPIPDFFIGSSLQIHKLSPDASKYNKIPANNAIIIKILSSKKIIAKTEVKSTEECLGMVSSSLVFVSISDAEKRKARQLQPLFGITSFIEMAGFSSTGLVALAPKASASFGAFTLLGAELSLSPLIRSSLPPYLARAFILGGSLSYAMSKQPISASDDSNYKAKYLRLDAYAGLNISLFNGLFQTKLILAPVVRDSFVLQMSQSGYYKYDMLRDFSYKGIAVELRERWLPFSWLGIQGSLGTILEGTGTTTLISSEDAYALELKQSGRLSQGDVLSRSSIANKEEFKLSKSMRWSAGFFLPTQYAIFGLSLRGEELTGELKYIDANGHKMTRSNYAAQLSLGIGL